MLRFLTSLTSRPLVDKQQKRGEHVENMKFSLDTQQSFMFLYLLTFFVFCFYPLEGQTYQAVFTSKFQVSLHFWQSWPTVQTGHSQVSIFPVLINVKFPRENIYPLFHLSVFSWTFLGVF
jgi:hypothetical protein